MMSESIPSQTPLSGYIQSWTGKGCRHIPDGSPFGVLDTKYSSRARENRWNQQGEPTLYLASDHGVLIAEFARHLHDQRTEEIGRATLSRRIFDVDLSVEHVLDLRDPNVCAAMSLSDAPHCFLDREVARATAGFLRRTTEVEALLLPSVAFLDQLERWVMAIFLDKLPVGI